MTRTRILLVEPYRTGLATMARRLGEAGYAVTCCASGADAVAELRRAAFDLVLSELRMAGTSGIDLLRLIRDDSGMADLPVILITGRTDASGAVEGFSAGADDVVAKPFHFEVLLARIGQRLARARAVSELRQDNATLDARVVTRAIELGEMRDAFRESEAERRRLAAIAAAP